MSDLQKLFNAGLITKDIYKSLSQKLSKIQEKKETKETIKETKTIKKTEKKENKKVRNPFTGRMITIGGKVHKKAIDRQKQELDEMIAKNNKINEKINRLNRSAEIVQMLDKSRQLDLKKQKVDNQVQKLDNQVLKRMTTKYEKVDLKYRQIANFKNKNVANNYEIKPNNSNKRDVDKFLSESIKTVIDINTRALKKLKGMKVYHVLKVEMVKGTGDDQMYATPHFHSTPYVLFNTLNMVTKIKESNKRILDLVDQFTENGSNWRVNKVESLYVNCAVYKPLRGSSYVELPPWIKNSKSCINVKNNDNKCFSYAILSCLYPAKSHSDRVSNHVKNLDKLNMKDIEYPVKACSYAKFEKQNDISINVLYTDEKEVLPLYTTSQKKIKHVDLLLHNNHYVWIKNMSALLNRGRSHDHKAYYCTSCLVGFPSQARLDEHIKRKCDVMTKVTLPKKNVTYFTDYAKQLDCPFVIYADFESITKPVDITKGKTQTYQNHEACSWAYKVVSRFPQYQWPLKLYRGPNASYEFVKSLVELEKEMRKILSKNEPMIITKKQEKQFNKAKKCHICCKKLGDDRVRDHCHITGLYRGPAHNKCNLQYKYSNKKQNKYSKIPVFFHNLKGYDSHLIIKELGNFEGNISCIPQSSEKFTSFSLGNLVFKDSLQFLGQSLDDLSKTLKSDQFEITRSNYQDMSDDKFKLLIKKGVYPYDYMDSFERFDETELPSKECFYSKLSCSDIGKDDYDHAVNVWDSFNIKTLGEYSDMYLKTDVLILTDIFENFRKICKSNYGLDASHYYTAPGLAWNAMLKMTKVRLELLVDIDEYNWFQNNIKGGISSSMKRYEKANNKYMVDYNPLKAIVYIMYLDANNLYGWAMIQCLPLDGYKYEKNLSKFTTEFIKNIPDDGDIGYVLEVDLKYPEELRDKQELHDKHNSYPLAPENIKIKKEELSDYCQNVIDEQDLHFVPTQKLTPNLRDKNNYVLHYRNLKLYLSLGLVLGKVHKVMSFRQSKWLKQYIMFNTNMRKKANNDFEKDFYKLMNNAVFGKTMENVFKRINYKLIKDTDDVEKYTKKPSYQSKTHISDNLLGISMKKQEVTADKPVMAGFSILDLSKVLMYDFYYNTLKAKYNENVELLYTDTDSFILSIKTDDVYEDFHNMKQYFDFSEYPEDHFCHSNDNKKVIGKFKDEVHGKIITEFVGLRSKMYSYIVQDDLAKNTWKRKKCKGISKSAVNSFTHEMYKKCINQVHVEKSTKMNTIRSFNHRIQSITLTKTSLSSYDDKRYLIDSINSYAYGHYRINQK